MKKIIIALISIYSFLAWKGDTTLPIIPGPKELTLIISLIPHTPTAIVGLILLWLQTTQWEASGYGNHEHLALTALSLLSSLIGARLDFPIDVWHTATICSATALCQVPAPPVAIKAARNSVIIALISIVLMPTPGSGLVAALGAGSLYAFSLRKILRCMLAREYTPQLAETLQYPSWVETLRAERKKS